MPDYTEKLRLPKPTGNETNNRAAHNALIDAVEAAIDRRFFRAAAAPSIGVDPDNAGEGDEWYNTTTKRMLFCDGTKWVDPLKYQ